MPLKHRNNDPHLQLIYFGANSLTCILQTVFAAVKSVIHLRKTSQNVFNRLQMDSCSRNTANWKYNPMKNPISKSFFVRGSTRHCEICDYNKLRRVLRSSLSPEKCIKRVYISVHWENLCGNKTGFFAIIFDCHIPSEVSYLFQDL